MKRLTEKDWDSVSGSVFDAVRRLQEIENILGDTYDLDHLRELVEAEKKRHINVIYHGQELTIKRLCDLLDRVTAERDAAQKLLAEHSGVAGCGIITTCFGYPMDKVRELIEADRAGLCVALPPRKLTEDEIMEAERLNAKIGRIIDNAVVELFERKAAEAALEGETGE